MNWSTLTVTNVVPLTGIWTVICEQLGLCTKP